jgi:hypothetical protein
MYKTHFGAKDFDTNILGFIQDKVDHLWYNYPTDYKSTYNNFFQDRSKNQLKEFGHSRP